MIIGRAKQAPHWGVQSRFRVIYICVCVYYRLVYLRLSMGNPYKKMVCQNAWAELRGLCESLKQSAALKP